MAYVLWSCLRSYLKLTWIYSFHEWWDVKLSSMMSTTSWTVMMQELVMGNRNLLSRL